MNQRMLTLMEPLRRGRERFLRGWTQHALARTAKRTIMRRKRPRRSLAEVSPDEDHGGHLGCWNDVHHRTQADAVRLYDVTIARVAAAP